LKHAKLNATDAAEAENVWPAKMRTDCALVEHGLETDTSCRAEDSRSCSLLRVVLGFTLILSCAGAAAQESESQPPSPPKEITGEIQTAPVKLDGKTLFTVRGLSAYPAEKRAQLVAEQIEAVAKDRRFAPQSLKLNETQYETEIMAGRLPVVEIFDGDAKFEEVGRQELAHAYTIRITEAIEAYRQAREPKVLIRHVAYALAAALALLLVLFGGGRIVRRLLAVLERRYRHRIPGVGIQALKVLPAERMWAALIGALKFVAAAAGVLAIYATLDYILSLFPWTRGLSDNLSGLVLNPLRIIGNRFIAAIPDLTFLLVLSVVTYYLLKVIRLVFTSVEARGIAIPGFDPTWSKPTYRLVRGFVIAFALVVAFPYIPGSDTQAFKGVTLFIGLVFSLGSKSLIGNLISGYSLTYRKMFKQGDRVEIGGHLGDVQESRLLVTYLHTVKNEIISVPNSSVVNSNVTNYSALAQTEKLILHTNVRIGYDTPWRQVEAMLLEAAARTPGLLREPPPFVLEKQLRTFSVEYEINAHCDNPQAMESLYSALHRNILDIFNEYGVQIMTPTYVSDPVQAKFVSKDRWYKAPAMSDSSSREERAAASVIGKEHA
jgi:small-conductance mechanosensitive channel